MNIIYRTNWKTQLTQNKSRQSSFSKHKAEPRHFLSFESSASQLKIEIHPHKSMLAKSTRIQTNPKLGDPLLKPLNL